MNSNTERAQNFTFHPWRLPYIDVIQPTRLPRHNALGLLQFHESESEYVTTKTNNKFRD